MSNIKTKIRTLLFSKVIMAVVMPVVIVNVIGILLLFGASLLMSYQEIYNKLSFSELVEFQTAVFVLIAIFEIILIFSVSYRFFVNSGNIASNVEDLLSRGENNEVEFKSSLRWDYAQNKVNKELEYVIVKTVSAFLNSNGGTILIGADDNKNVLGLENDYASFKKKNADGFLVYIAQIINYHLGKGIHRFLNIDIVQVRGKEICLIQIRKAKNPVYVNYNDHQEFFIRTGASVQPMEIRDAHDYIANNWKKK